MNLEQWDKEASSICDDVLRAEIFIKSRAHDMSGEISALKSSIQSSIDVIETSLEKTLYLANPRQNSFSQHAKTLIYWASKFSDVAQKYKQDFSKVAMMDLWISLIEKRVSGQQLNVMNKSIGLSNSKNRVSLLKIKKSLKEKNRKVLRSRLTQLESQKNELVSEYNRLVLEKTNREAAGSMQELYVKVGAESGYPVLEALERLLINASRKVGNKKSKNYISTQAALSEMATISLDGVARYQQSKYLSAKEGFVSSDIEETNQSPQLSNKVNSFVRGEQLAQSYDLLAKNLMDFNPDLAADDDDLPTAMRERIATLEVRRSNRSAAEQSSSKASFVQPKNQASSPASLSELN